MSQQTKIDSICNICQKSKSKYKCPQCNISYCSSVCFKQHKRIQTNNQSLCSILMRELKSDNVLKVVESGQNQLMEDIDLVKTDYIQDQSLRLSQSQLNQLAQNEKLMKMLKSSKLREKMHQIDNSRMRLNMLQKALLDQQFMNFADQALRTVNKNKN